MTRLLSVLSLMLLTAPIQAAEITAPPFTLQDDTGKTISLPSRRDGVDILLFWASWCPYCKALMPHLQSIKIEYGDRVRVYALNIRDDEDPIGFMQEHGYDFILLPDADPVMPLYGVQPTPGLFLVDKQGSIRFNIYDLIVTGDGSTDAMSHRQQASRRAPYWAAAIRKKIDEILAGQADN